MLWMGEVGEIDGGEVLERGGERETFVELADVVEEGVEDG
jgi:hypothetical protein